MAISINKVHELCNYVYYGMSLKEAFILANEDFDELYSRDSDDAGAKLRRTLLYAKHKAKYQLMHMAHELATSSKPTLYSTRMLQHLVSSRCGYTETRQELKVKQMQHKELMSFRRENMRNWSDYQSAKMVNEASGATLQSYVQLETKEPC